jgi:transcription-repair coupling factor (superfamily II helicase)
MLERAVAELKGVEVSEPVRPSISIRLDAFIPDSYIEDMALRLSAYRSVASASSREDLNAIKEEMADRFGNPPEEFINLLKVMELRLMAEPLRIIEISQTDRRLKFVFSDEAPMTAEKISGVFERDVRFYPEGFDLPLKDIPYAAVREALEALARTLN